MELNFLEIVSAFIILFAVIDILGSMPIVVNLRKNGGEIKAWQATIVAFIILIAFLFLGKALLSLFGVDINSFAIAGSFVLFIIALEMVLGLEIFKQDSPGGASIVPIAFPLLAGPGTFTTLLSLRSQFDTVNIIIALVMNMIVVFFVLRSTRLMERLLGAGGIYVMKKMFGIILLAVAIKLFMSNFAVLFAQLTGKA